ncbi:hypothetical protein DSC45_06840 [Streptomyces sp. YIM 130001]|uniref:DUF3311 domain-containing protein n=1 Tax=Streptomyces sp. YIM 130001 TaxID=2259644 RepID=UPI000E646FF2|nr:DUF3311 domain-containing protein [Streptomyces sp. YIM 130001]RII19710.1 hypothetical protein DSC45_06840 [Streptomyces sp. YIM 130001]
MLSRPHLLWLLVPFVLYIGALPFVNRVEPVIAGLPFLFVWLLGATVLTVVAAWLTWHGDRHHRAALAQRARDAEPEEGGR